MEKEFFMKNILNSLNNVLNTANRTASTVNRTKSMAKTVTGAGKDKQKEPVWKCACGKKNSAKFCEKCGKPKPVCPQCGVDIKGAKFCPECGTAID